jgi:hypothetical protein
MRLASEQLVQLQDDDDLAIAQRRRARHAGHVAQVRP